MSGFRVEDEPLVSPDPVREETAEEREYRELKEMKSLGFDKPSGVSDLVWNGPRDISHQHLLMAHFAAGGASIADIANEMGVSRLTVSKALAHPGIQLEIKRLRDKFSEKYFQKRFMNILPKAIDTAEGVMSDTSEKGNVRADVAFKFMERALGKPRVDVDLSSNMLKELIEKLDFANSKPVETSSVPIESSGSIPIAQSNGNDDEISKWVDENILEHKGVGSRHEKQDTE